MKKKNLKTLLLNKKSISKLQSNTRIGGGTDWPDTAKYCPEPPDQGTDPGPSPGTGSDPDTLGGTESNIGPICPTMITCVTICVVCI